MKKNGPWTIEKSSEKYRNDFFAVIEDAVINPGGEKGEYATIEMKPGVCVLPIDENGDVYLTKQFRYGFGAESLEVIAGGMESDDALENAKREAREEIGLEAEEWIEFGTAETDTSIVKSPAHFFIAKQLKFAEPEREAVEVMKIVKMSLNEAAEKVLSSEIRHAASCILILKAKLKENK